MLIDKGTGIHPEEFTKPPMDKLLEKIIPFIDAATPDNCPHCGNKITVLSEQAAHYIKQLNFAQIDHNDKLPWWDRAGETVMDEQ